MLSNRISFFFSLYTIFTKHKPIHHKTRFVASMSPLLHLPQGAGWPGPQGCRGSRAPVEGGLPQGPAAVLGYSLGGPIQEGPDDLARGDAVAAAMEAMAAMAASAMAASAMAAYEMAASAMAASAMTASAMASSVMAASANRDCDDVSTMAPSAVCVCGMVPE